VCTIFESPEYVMVESTDVRAALKNKTAELIVAGLTLALGVIVMVDNWRIGAKWAEDGPETGYFPFYVGVLITIGSIMNLLNALRMAEAKNGTFVEVGQLKLVLSVLVPSAVYVVLVGLFGIYVPSIVFIAFFMRWLGKYGWGKVLGVSVGTAAFFYAVFEIWFMVPLPKGPIEAMLGLG
jgi:putative tricarboxylic transport membrane protein